MQGKTITVFVVGSLQAGAELFMLLSLKPEMQDGWQSDLQKSHSHPVRHFQVRVS